MIHVSLGGALLARVKLIVKRSDKFYNFYQNYVSWEFSTFQTVFVFHVGHKRRKLSWNGSKQGYNVRRFCLRSVLRSVRNGGFFEILIEMIQNNKTDGR